MRLEQFTSHMVDIYYPSQFKEMSHFIDEEWISSTEASFPEFPNAFDGSPPTTLPFTSPETPSDLGFVRPRNSPRPSYRHHVQDLIFPSMGGLPTTQRITTQGLGIESIGTPLLPSNLSSPTSESMPAMSWDLGRRRSTPIPIAPNPTGVLRQMRDSKRPRDDSDTVDVPTKHRRKSTSYQSDKNLNEEERLILELKEEKNLPWKEIAQKFEATLGRTYQVPALQMRYTRLKDKRKTWTEDDDQALYEAYTYWENNRFEIIAMKMNELRPLEKWSKNNCEKRWRELHPETSTTSTLPLPPAHQWLHDTPGSVYGTPLPLTDIPEQQQTPGLRTPGMHTPGIRTPRIRSP